MPLNHLIWQHFFLFMLEGDVMTQHSYSESEWGDAEIGSTLSLDGNPPNDRCG